MNVFLSVKQAGKKGYLTRLPFIMKDEPQTLSQFITYIVEKNVKDYNTKKVDPDFVKYLVKEDIDAGTSIGKIGFGRRFGNKDANTKKAIEAALLAFTDGLYRVYVDEKEIQTLEEIVPLKEESIIVFIRLTFLAGSMW